ncbi:MAG: ABC transporter permease [Anaerolineae bacterium]
MSVAETEYPGPVRLGSVGAWSVEPAYEEEHLEAETARNWRHAVADAIGAPTALVGVAILLVFGLVALLAPVLPLADPEAVSVMEALAAPSAAHPLGTDDIGRDVLSRLVYAGRVSLLIGLGVALVSATVGTAFGALAGYFGGAVDGLVVALTNVLQSFPALVLVAVIGSMVTLDPTRLLLVMAALSWVSTARLVRAQALSLREQQYIEAARSLGASDARIIATHLIPNTLGAVLVSATLQVAFTILSESALSFLGFGVRPPTATWGSMLNAAQSTLRDAPWLGLFPGVAIALTVLSFDLIGNALQEKIDPRLRHR